MNCNECKNDLPESAFRRTGRGYYRRTCEKCDWQIRKRRAATDPVYAEKRRTLNRKWSVIKSANEKSERASRVNTEIYILRDSRKSDKRKGFVNDLDKEFIKTKIANKCSYCGASTLRMTLDRIDNSIGHLKSNVVPACIRCNYIRRDMPYEAWLRIVPLVCAATSEGLFDGWNAFGSGGGT